MMVDVNKIRWQCRRGMKELDVMLTRFVDAEYAQLNEVDRQSFHQVLNMQDPDLYQFLMGNRVPTDPDAVNIINRIRVVSGV